MDERRLTFGEHLDELRSHIIRALIYVGVSVAACLIFQDSLLQVVLWPQQRVAHEGRPERLAEAAAKLQALMADLGARPLESRTAAERAALGRRFDEVFAGAASGPEPRLNFLTPQEAFLAYLKVAFICGLFLASPLFIYELWKFVAAGLRPNEKRYVRIFGPISFGCFVAGVLFGYFVLIPTSLDYLETYGSRDLVVATITLDGYLDLFLGLTLAVGLIFEVPIVLVFLSIIGVVNAAKLAHFRRYFVLLATIIAAVVTPTGDPLTLSIVALPLIILYEVGVAGVRMIERGRPAPVEEEDEVVVEEEDSAQGGTRE